MKSKIILAILLSLVSSTAYSISKEDLVKVYASLVDQWKDEVSIAFDKAEKEVYNVDPKPDNIPVGPNEDPNKCVCKGTGKIVHGDGHTTPCPYHSKTMETK
jgi:hypothetical protein